MDYTFYVYSTKSNITKKAPQKVKIKAKPNELIIESLTQKRMMIQ